jgi:hypothetical protein
MRRDVRVDEGRKPACARCLRLEEELRDIRQRLAASGQYVAYSPGPNPYPDVEEELRRWRAIEPGADAADGFRAGWTRLARAIGPRLQDWEARWLRARRVNAGLKSHITALVAEIRRLEVR